MTNESTHSQPVEATNTADTPTSCSACGATDFEPNPIVGSDLMLAGKDKYSVFRCTKCGSGTTSPFVAEQDLGALYEGVYAPFDDFSVRRGLGSALKSVQKLVDWHFHHYTVASAVRQQQGSLLEVGCGTGRFGGAFVKRGWRVFGVEPSPIAAEHARHRGMTIHEGTLSTFEVPGEKFDVVMFRHSLEHVVFPREDLARVAAMLKPGGKLLIEVPNFGCWQVKTFGKYWFNLSLPLHRTHFTADGLRAATRSAGFEEVELKFKTGALCIPVSLEYRATGRWLHSTQWSNIALVLGSFVLLPLTMTLDRIRGGGDNMHYVARLENTSQI